MRLCQIVVATALLSLATLPVCWASSGKHSLHDRTAEVEALLGSKRWTFRPTTMQNASLGTTRDVYAYNFALAFDGGRLEFHLPIESVSFVIYTEPFSAMADNYSLTLVDEGWWRVLFTVKVDGEEWAVEMAVVARSGAANLAVVAREWTMRYVGALYPLEK